MKHQSLLRVLGLSLVVLFSTLSYAEPKLFSSEVTDDNRLPEDVKNHIRQRTLCNQARTALIFRDTPKAQIPANPQQQAQQSCTGSDTRYQALSKKYQNNSKVLNALSLVNGFGDIIAIDAPIQFGQTIDALMPKDILAFLPRFSDCLHFAGEFGGDRSERDKEINKTMRQLKCHQINRKLARLTNAHKNNPDALMLLKTLSGYF